eukprot:TRINITY_DN1225_c0_g1_i1.p1 TRINITY_DN1225_c0_g1~~TRINITY_DN1225_c0_g1_i1.p1  ORF type:complete len:316 (+),score=2.56 TRINITY_DN1225_c0_g1_i1:419-1366(+)
MFFFTKYLKNISTKKFLTQTYSRIEHMEVLKNESLFCLIKPKKKERCKFFNNLNLQQNETIQDMRFTKNLKSALLKTSFQKIQMEKIDKLKILAVDRFFLGGFQVNSNWYSKFPKLISIESLIGYNKQMLLKLSMRSKLLNVVILFRKQKYKLKTLHFLIHVKNILTTTQTKTKIWRSLYCNILYTKQKKINNQLKQLKLNLINLQLRHRQNYYRFLECRNKDELFSYIFQKQPKYSIEKNVPLQIIYQGIKKSSIAFLKSIQQKQTFWEKVTTYRTKTVKQQLQIKLQYISSIYFYKQYKQFSNFQTSIIKKTF